MSDQDDSGVCALKGFGHGGRDALAIRQLKSLNLDWHYTWRSRAVTNDPPFVPMVRDAGDLQESAHRYVTEALPVTGAEHLLGFNEPDLKGQANMTTGKAVELWPQLEAFGLRLGSPATTKPDAWWLGEFMRKAKNKGLRIDFMTMHCYGWPNAEDFLRKVRELHERYDRPVWVTEYAVADWKATSTTRNRYSRAQVEDFMRETVAGMRAMPYVERFAWKTRPAGDIPMRTSSLFHTDGSLTSTGRLYASL